MDTQNKAIELLRKLNDAVARDMAFGDSQDDDKAWEVLINLASVLDEVNVFLREINE